MTRSAGGDGTGAARPMVVAGVVLAGGLSRRMGGGDKGLLALGDKPMLAHVIERFAPQVASLAINANGDPGRFAQFGLSVVADPIEGFVGPLAGVLAGLRWARAAYPEATHVASVSADAPFLPLDLVSRLAAALAGRPAAIAVAETGGELHPVIGLWPVALADDLEASLRAGVRKVLAWTDRHGTVPVAFEPVVIGGEAIDPFYNANTPGELAEAGRILQRTAAGGRVSPPFMRTPGGAPIIGIAGWKKSGKTTLTVRLVETFTRRGYRVATIKHAHHAFQIDDGDTDSARHRRAGAGQVAIVSSQRWAIVTELAGEPEPDFSDVVARLQPADLVIVEGYKSAPIPKIEARRTAAFERRPLTDHDPLVIAIAADHPVQNARVPVFSLDDIEAVADFAAAAIGLVSPRPGSR